MLPLLAATIWLELVAMAVAVLPLGAILLRGGERLFRRRFGLAAPERALLAFYASGAFLFVLASVPIAFYGLPLVSGAILVGAIGYAVLSVQEGGKGLRFALNFARTVPGTLLALLTLGLLAVEVYGTAPLTLPNMLDGSLHSLFVNLLLSNHTLPWTARPYAPVGVTYPQGAPVWMSLPVLLFGWPIYSAPLDIPPLFLALPVVASFCLGQRLSHGFRLMSAAWVGTLFAAFFALIATWPRLAIGGSFDFAFGFPLFILALGWLIPLAQSPVPSHAGVLAFGVVVGIECSLSLMLGMTLLVLLAWTILLLSSPEGPSTRTWILRWLAVVGISAGFLVRSLIGIVVWFDYPGHVLVPAGSRPYPPSGIAQPLTARILNGELNPFVLFKPKLSPIPWFSLELMILTAAGLVVLLLAIAGRRGRLRNYLPEPMSRWIIVGTTAAFTLVLAILLADAFSLSVSGVGSVTDYEEASDVLFFFYELIALVPLIVAAAFLADRGSAMRPRRLEAQIPVRRPVDPRRWPGVVIVALVALVILIPVGSGLATTAVVVPGYITDHIEQLANVTPQDLVALKWAGANLPECSRVLVAPGSVGQYLPEFARLVVIYPAFPDPANLSYYIVNEDLVAGEFTNTTAALMLELGVTEVLVSGQNSVSYPPFQLAPLLASPDLRVLEKSGDVTILEFLPGATGAECVPSAGGM